MPRLVPMRMGNEYVNCPRLLYLEWAQGDWADNWFTEDRKLVHRRVGRESGSLPAPEQEEPPPFVARSVAASSERLGLTTNWAWWKAKTARSARSTTREASRRSRTTG